jgi:hypothetical protein
MLFWNYWLGHGNTIFYFIKTTFCYYLILCSWKYLLSYLCSLSITGFNCQRPNIFSLARLTRDIVHQYVVYHNEDCRPLLRVYKCPTQFPCQMMSVYCNSNMMGATSGAGTAHSSEAHSLPLVFCRFSIYQCLVFCVVFC